MTTAATRERPILFSGAMVRAILDGRKTQTRRVIIPQPDASLNYGFPQRVIDRLTGVGTEVATGRRVFQARNFAGPILAFRDGKHSVTTDIACPFGDVGGRLWVREAFSYSRNDEWHRSDFWYWADGNPSEGDWEKPKPSIHMPRWASRLTLEITGVRVERVQSITRDDAKAEGITEYGEGFGKEGEDEWRNRSSVENYRVLWDSLNAKRGFGWGVNPWVWVVEFRRAGSPEQAENVPNTYTNTRADAPNGYARAGGC